ncbi:MAG: riboflavin synthase [Myxococcota bacterium]|jgi:riboflavin synthase
MFTGIVEVVGTVTGIEPHEESTTLEIEAPTIVPQLGVGDSVSVNGGCLTVARLDGDRLRCDAVRETLDRTALGDLAVGARVNLERALRADGRLDGHFVQGHVDGTGCVRHLERRADDVRLFVDCGSDFADLLVEKGSVAIDGVSLTVVGVSESGFDVALIPHTLAETTLGDRRPGDRMNLEADVLGKYVKRYLQRVLPETAPSGKS